MNKFQTNTNFQFPIKVLWILKFQSLGFICFLSFVSCNFNSHWDAHFLYGLSWVRSHVMASIPNWFRSLLQSGTPGIHDAHCKSHGTKFFITKSLLTNNILEKTPPLYFHTDFCEPDQDCHDACYKLKRAIKIWFHEDVHIGGFSLSCKYFLISSLIFFNAFDICISTVLTDISISSAIAL